MNDSFVILYQDDEILVANKPATLPVQDDLTTKNSLLTVLQDRNKRKLYLVHRIDRPVSGVVVFAKKKKGANKLSFQFQTNTVNKTYLALVSKNPPSNEGRLEHVLAKQSKRAKSYVVEKNKKGKTCITEYRTVGNTEKYTILKTFPKTGRFHQIRAQLSAIGCPIKGDVKYGARRANKDRSIHLHAYEIEFVHPGSGEKVNFSAPLPIEPLWQAVDSIIRK